MNLLDKAKSLPRRPGCYLMKKGGPGNEVILYVGKAKNLSLRVSSYFNNSAKTPKTEILVSHIEDFDFIISGNESEAFILENNLIKKYSPKYNILLKDDKSYPYVSVDLAEPFSRLVYTRRVKRRKLREHFGPFVVGSNISEVLKVIVKSFRLRDCSLREFRGRKTACLLYQINQCSAPCVGKITESEYENDLKMALSFFKGSSRKSIEYLERKMFYFAEKEDYEHAAILRDDIELLKGFVLNSRESVVEREGERESIDLLAFHIGDSEIDISLYILRSGLLLGIKKFHFPRMDLIHDIEEEITLFLYQYYISSVDIIPNKLIVNLSQENNELLSLTLTKSLEQKISVKNSSKKYSELMKLTKDHAMESQRVRLFNQDSEYLGLNKLQELLSLKERPVNMECYDIAVFQGSSPTAAKIVFENGKANKSKYRHYHLEERPEGNNDFAMMKETLILRLESGDFPDLFVVDGGKGQVNQFREVLKDLNIEIPVIGIAKSKVKKGEFGFKSSNVERSVERLIIPGRINSYSLSDNKSLFRMLTQMRDEAHRFSRILHHKAEKKKLFTSWIDKVEGVGPRTKQNILMNLKVREHAVAKMSESELMRELGVSLRIAKNIIKSLNK